MKNTPGCFQPGVFLSEYPPSLSHIVLYQLGKAGSAMGYEELGRMSHHLILEDRENLTVSGVEEVESFDENTIVMDTAQGTLIVRGEGLHIEKLSLDGGDLKVEGMVESLTYEETRGHKGGFFARLLG